MEKILENRISLDTIDASRTAILAIHWQNDAAKPDGAFGPSFAKTVQDSGVIGRTVSLVDAGRSRGARVAYVNVAFWPDCKGLPRNNSLFNTVVRTGAFKRGTRGAEVIDELSPSSDDYIFEHSRISGFYGTELDAVLRADGIENLLLTGIATNVAVDHTARDAAQFGYKVFVVEDCCCSSDQQHHDAALATLRVVATEVLTLKECIERLR